MGRSARSQQVHLRAQEHRVGILRRLRHRKIRFDPVAPQTARAMVNQFMATVRFSPQLDHYFDRRHIVNMQHYLDEVQAAYVEIHSRQTRKPKHGTLEIVAVPTSADRTMGFHIYKVYEAGNLADPGVVVGYLIHSMELTSSTPQQVKTVRLAYDIFIPYRSHQYKPVPFSSDDVYNFSRAWFLRRYAPEIFFVDEKTQIRETRTGDPILRASYYLKRGYFPPNRRSIADRLLVTLLDRGHGSVLTAQEWKALFRRTSFGWIFPVGELAELQRPADT